MRLFIVRTHAYAMHQDMQEIVRARTPREAAELFAKAKRAQDPRDPPVDVAYVFALNTPVGTGVVSEGSEEPTEIRLRKERIPGVDFD